MGARALGAYMRFALASTRWTLHGRDQIGPYLYADPAIFVFWHERLPLMPALWMLALRERKGRIRGRMHILVSRHQDGRLIGEVMRGFGVELVYGSTARGPKQRGSVASVRALAAALQEGGQVGITPDGPRGPPRHAAPGAVQLASMTAAPVIPLAAQTSRRRVLPTWDRMVLPLPFGRGVLVCGPPITVPREGWEACLPRIEAALTRVTDEADTLCRA